MEEIIQRAILVGVDLNNDKNFATLKICVTPKDSI